MSGKALDAAWCLQLLALVFIGKVCFLFGYFVGKVYWGMLEKGEKYNGRFQIDASGTCHFLSFYANLNLSELSTTLTLEKAIRALAHIGVIWKSMPKI